MRTRILLLALTACAATLLSACGEDASKTPAAADAVVVTTDAPYYRDGPMQGRPPDGTFKAGTRLKRHTETIGTYVLVESADGPKGYVESGSLRPAPD